LFHGFERIGRDRATGLYIVDASVVLKWILSGEPYELNAAALRDDVLTGNDEISAPNLLIHEVNNSLWKAIKQKRITQEEARKALESINETQIILHEITWTDALDILTISSKIDMTTYDASYLFLSEKTNANVITADDKMYEKAKGNFKVIHLKNYL
jgi:predicted nucleic acid-binding protein